MFTRIISVRSASWVVALAALILLGSTGAGQQPAAKPAAVKTPPPYTKAIECLKPSNASAWIVENPRADAPAAFRLESDSGKDTLRIATGALEPARSTVRILLPGDGPENGDVWAKYKATYISFLCKSTKPAEMSFHLLMRGKTAGTYQAAFTAAPGEWQRVMLPLQAFGLKSFLKIAGVGFRSASTQNQADVIISDILVGALPYTDDSWKASRLSVPLSGTWKFATDPGERGMAEKWFGDTLDDTAWKPLKSGLSWQEQGVAHHGWGWYRRTVTLPKEAAGTAMTLMLPKIPSDDDVWINGVRVGGWSGEYKYDNEIPRAYTVPASQLRYGQENTIALRIWGGNLSFIGNKSGLIAGPLSADFDPYRVQMREPGGTAVPAELFDLSNARQGKPFEIVLPQPPDLMKEGAKLAYRLTDLLGNAIAVGSVPLKDGVAPAIAVSREAAQQIYLRGRLRVHTLVEDAAGRPLYSGIRDLDHLNFTGRDSTPLPSLPDRTEETPYGQLKLVDEIDCSTSLFDDPHPYMQSGFDKPQLRMTPGSPVDVTVTEILGKKARESSYGWFAYRIGRGKLKPHGTYLLRIEYPEDKPRFAPIEIQTGQNFSDIGWKNGVGPNDPYDNWPLSGKWQWYDTIVPLDDETTGTGGTGTAPAENGLWVYFMNKLKPGQYYAMWSGGPAVARIKLYEIHPEKHAPRIRRPEGLPSRVLSFDWERQPDHDPADFCRYAKLMGYNAISPVIVKWAFANYGDPLPGYQSVAIDDRNYWSRADREPAPGEAAAPVIPGKKSQHALYLEATKRYGINYIPRIEWGGSQDLPKEARAVDPHGDPTKPNRFAPWCSNLLHPATWDDLQKLIDHMVKPYAKDNPQLTGVLWRIRCNRLPISYGKADIELFAKETGTKLPPGGAGQWGAWASGEMKVKYDDWWHQKRADFHSRLAGLLRTYRQDMTLYYYNWDEDKFGLIQPSTTAWAFVQNVVKPLPEGGRAAYEREAAARKALTAADYTEVLRTGNFGPVTAARTNRADYGLRPSFYKDQPGIQLFAPVDFRCYADLPDYLNYFKTADGLAISHVVSYDEVGSRTINPKYEGNMVTPAGPNFSMALELLSYFHGDSRTLNYTVYTYGRGFTDAHRRFAQAFLALPAIEGRVVESGDADVKVRTYTDRAASYVGVAHKGHAEKKLTVKLPGVPQGAKVTNLVTDESIPTRSENAVLCFDVPTGPMELHAFLVQ